MRNILTSILSIIIGLTVGFLFMGKNIDTSNKYTLILILAVAILALVPIYRKSYFRWKDEQRN
ncbi:hypothetical protein [Lysinibacillus sp. NPDC047702]|uniref:hypothetical protein n=1 Tax=unclassified Lysinibacillus TaxID=2636778 RepID=UPI003D070845